MTFPNVFDKDESIKLVGRVNSLNAESKASWGNMNVAQLMAHCNVTYDYVFEPNKYEKPSGFKKWMIKTFVKGSVLGPKPYKRNSPTAPDFKAAGESSANFDIEKDKLIGNIIKVQDLGESHFDGAESHSFGQLNIEEWNTMFYKHLDHHLTQFGV